jgi:hypothetical protein
MALMVLLVEIGAENEFSRNLISKFLTFSSYALAVRCSLGN